MTRIAYLDCFAGLSGDMFLSALMDAGLDEMQLRKHLASAGIEPEEVIFSKTDRQGISAIAMEVNPSEAHHHLHVAGIRKMIGQAAIPEPVRNKALKAFERIVAAETKIHNMPPDHVHLHEVSELDTVVDLLGAAVGLYLLDIDRIVSSPLQLGSGTVTFSHGTYPVPAPATVEILKGIPVAESHLPGERVTPTGAALAATFVQAFGSLPAMILDRTGYGAGSRTGGPVPNVLRIVIGSSDSGDGDILETLTLIETFIDDQQPEQLAYLQEKLHLEGVLESVVVPATGKKGRTGFLLRILCRPDQKDPVSRMILAETTTLGLRFHTVDRMAIPRRIESVQTPWGSVQVKIAGTTISPEFQSCKTIAEKSGVPLKSVYAAASAAAEKLRSS